MRCGDVQEAELIRPGSVIGLGDFYRVAGIAKIDEVDTLHHAPVFHVEAGDETRLQHRGASRIRRNASGTSIRPS